MSSKDIVAAAVGVLLVAAVATVAIGFALDDGGNEGLRERVEELEARVEELEEQLGSARLLPRSGAHDLPRLLEDLPLDEDLLGRFFGRFDEGFDPDEFRLPEDRRPGNLPPDFRFNFDPSFIDDLVGAGFLDGDQAQALRHALETLRRALEEAAGR